MKTILPLLLLLAAGLLPVRSHPPLESELEPFLGEPAFGMQQLYPDGRFPNVAVSRHGTVLAAWGSDGVDVRRSSDGGESWGGEIAIASWGYHGGGLTVDERGGSILAFVEERHPPAPMAQFRSLDEGATWRQEKMEVAADSRGNLPSLHMNESGITLRRGPHKGRLIRPTRHFGKSNDRSEWPTHYTNAIYSDDSGLSWKTSDPFPEHGTGEAALVQLVDASLYYNSRLHWQERPESLRRRSARSQDGGLSWKDWRIVKALPDGPQDTSYGCMGGLARLPVLERDILLYSNCDSPSGRRRGTVWTSFDGGRTWPARTLVFEGAFAYSSIAAGRPGTPSEGRIFLFFEGGPEGGGTMARFNLSWLRKHAVATGDGDLPEDWAGRESGEQAE